MSKKIAGGSQLTDNWAAKCVLLKKRFIRLTDGDLLIEPDDPGSEGRMFDKLTVKTGLGLDSLHQLVYGLLNDKDVPFEARHPKQEPAEEKVDFDEHIALLIKKAQEVAKQKADKLKLKLSEVTPDITKEVVNKGEVTDEEVALRQTINTKKEKILANFYTLSENDLDYDQDINGSFEGMLSRGSVILGLSRDALVTTINSL